MKKKKEKKGKTQCFTVFFQNDLRGSDGQMEEEVKTLCDKGARICSKESLITVLGHPIYPLDTVKDFTLCLPKAWMLSEK